MELIRGQSLFSMCTVHVNMVIVHCTCKHVYCTCKHMHCTLYSVQWTLELRRGKSVFSIISRMVSPTHKIFSIFNMLPWICFIYDLTALSWPLTPNLFELPFKQHVSNNMPPSLGQTPSNTENNDLQNSEVFVQKMQPCERTKHTVKGQNFSH